MSAEQWIGDESRMTALAQDVWKEWSSAHGAVTGEANALIGPACFAVQIEGAFTRAEKLLAEQNNGRALLTEYLESLGREVSARLARRVEETLGRRVSSISTAVNLDAGWVICVFELAKTG